VHVTRQDLRNLTICGFLKQAAVSFKGRRRSAAPGKLQFPLSTLHNYSIK